MKLSKQLQLEIGKVLVITVCYILINVLIFYLNYAIIHSPFSLGPSEKFDVKSYLTINLLIGLISGPVGGTALIIVNSKYFRRHSFGFALITTAITYVSVFLLVYFISITVGVGQDYGFGGINVERFKAEWLLVSDSIFISNFILWGLITLFTLFILQVNDKFGPGILLKFLAGKYHQPKKEERIFMFMDMRSSTTIAEQIGNEKYFNLLNDLFADVTDTILNHQGEIYQYVGDEIVISWSVSKGVKEANCLNCFMEIQQKLIEMRSIYKQKYGVTPEFKAGIHYGMVMAGEVGVIKKDIIYSGDVLNTTARIQELCNQHQVELLISKETFDLIPDRNAFELKHVGNIELRGKKTLVDVNAVSKIPLKTSA